MSKEQAELLRMLRKGAATSRAQQEKVSLGLAGVALAEGASAGGSRRIARWTGEGKPWNELGGGERVARATVNTSRFVFIGAGAALTLVIAYALSSELFAPNSPTVIYEQACKLIQKSPKVHQVLLEPYSFQTQSGEYGRDFSPLNPPSNPRRPSETVRSLTYRDAQTGRESLYLHFYIDAREKNEELSYWQIARASVVSGAQWLKVRATEAYDELAAQWEQGPEPAPELKLSPLATIGADASTAPSTGRSEPWWITRQLRSATRGVSELVGSAGDAFGIQSNRLVETGGAAALSRSEPGTWSSGEVHIEMEMDNDGRYQYKAFHIDVPRTGSAMRNRITLFRSELPKR